MIFRKTKSERTQEFKINLAMVSSKYSSKTIIMRTITLNGKKIDFRQKLKGEENIRKLYSYQILLLIYHKSEN